MPIPLKEFLADAPKRDVARITVESCVTCGAALQETIAGYRPTHDGPQCSDCYFDSLSALVDEHPIGRPVAARGIVD